MPYGSYASILEIVRHKNFDGKIVATIAGGGYSFSDILKYPGASNIIEEIFCPYGNKSLYSILQETHERMLCVEVATDLAIGSQNYLGPDFIYVGVTAALRTNRQRKGEEAAYLTILRPNHEPANYKITFKKYQPFSVHEKTNDAIRLCQDVDLAQCIWAILLEDESCLPILAEVIDI